MWLFMRGALSEQVRLVHKQTYAPSVANIATLVLEDLGGPPDPQAIEQHRRLMARELEGIDALEGTYPFTQARSHANLKINAFLHDLVKPAHRERFRKDFAALAQEYGLSQEEQDLIAQRQWLALVRRGVSFFVLEKMAAVLGISNPQDYAAFRGETLEQFLATRKAAITYSVAGAAKT